MLSIREQRYLCLQSFYHFVKLVGGSVNQGGIISKEIHKPLCQFFQDPNEKRIGILMPRDWRKCVSPDTLVQMADGSERRIADIKVGDRIVGYDGFRQVLAQVVSTHSQKANLHRFRFRSGRELIASDKHRFLQVDGYKAMPNYGAYPRCLKTEPTSSITPDEAAIVAYLVAEGCLVSSNMTFTNGIPEVQEDFKRLVRERGWGYRLITHAGCQEYRLNGGNERYSKKKGPRHWARELGLWGKSSFQKTLPDAIMSAGLDVAKRVLEVLFSTDGNISQSQGYPKASYTSVNRRLCIQVQNLLNRLGIYSKIFFRPNEYSGSYTVAIQGVDSFRKFANTLDVLGKKESVSWIKEWATTQNIPDKSSANLIPDEVKALISERGLRAKGTRIDNNFRMSRAKASRIPSLRKLIEADVNWDDVVSCEPLGEQVSCDIETSSGNYVADGIITHNSTVFTKWGAIWLYLRNPEERIAIVAETEKIASNMLDGIEKLILGCKKLRELFPELLVVDKSWTKLNKWSGVECMLPRKGFYSEPTITCLGVGAAAQSRHFTTAIFDDLCGKNAMESAIILEDTLRWFDNYHELLVEPQTDKEDASRAIYVGTHWIIGDLPSYIMTEYKDEFKWRVVPAQRASEERVKDAVKEKPNVFYVQNESQEVGESNWPEQFSTEYYTEMAANPQKQMIFWTQHMNMPTSADGINTIKYEWIKGYYFETDIEGTRWVVCKDDLKKFRISDMVIRAVIDPGGFAQGSGIKKGSRNAYVIVGQTRNTNRKFILETWAQKIASPAAMMKQIFKAQERWHVQSWHVEVYASQGYILKNIREERDKANIRMVVMELPSEHTDDAKNKRIQGLIQPISNGEVYMHMETQRDAIAELINHPGGLTHDLADCMGWHAKMFWTAGLYGATKNLNRKNLDAYIEARGAGR